MAFKRMIGYAMHLIRARLQGFTALSEKKYNRIAADCETGFPDTIEIDH